MESPVNPQIEAFYKAFPIKFNLTVNIDSVVYNNQTYRPLDTVKQANDLIKEMGLTLHAEFSPYFKRITIKLFENKVNETFNFRDEYVPHFQKLKKA